MLVEFVGNIKKTLSSQGARSVLSSDDVLAARPTVLRHSTVSVSPRALFRSALLIDYLVSRVNHYGKSAHDHARDVLRPPHIYHPTPVSRHALPCLTTGFTTSPNCFLHSTRRPGETGLTYWDEHLVCAFFIFSRQVITAVSFPTPTVPDPTLLGSAYCSRPGCITVVETPMYSYRS